MHEEEGSGMITLLTQGQLVNNRILKDLNGSKAHAFCIAPNCLPYIVINY